MNTAEVSSVKLVWIIEHFRLYCGRYQKIEEIRSFSAMFLLAWLYFVCLTGLHLP